jgi:ABC-type Fe3+-hydroxamate transport system substrate-binding protein
VKTDILNGVALFVALVLGAAGAAWQSGVGPEVAKVVGIQQDFPSDLDALPDARGVVVPTAHYQRIVSLNPVADHLLLGLVEPERLIGITAYTLEGHVDAWRFGDRQAVGRSEDLEHVLSLQPDLVVTSEFSDEAYMARLREEGIQVFDLGNMRGVDSTIGDVLTLGALLKQQARGHRIVNGFRRELSALEGQWPSKTQPLGLYLSVLGDSIFGGTAGTSYADMLHYGGVKDLAAEHGFKDWPRYNPEQLLKMNPSIIITQKGTGDVICGHSALGLMAACSTEGHILELSGDFQSDPGLGLVESAAEVQALLRSALGGP